MKFKPLDHTLIDSDVCIRCGHCCKWTTKTHIRNSKGIDWLDAVVEDNELVGIIKHNSVKLEDGTRAEPFEIELRCSKLVIDNEEKTAKCSIYLNRPQVCSDYNCFEHANNLKRRPQNFERIQKLIKEVHGIDVEWENEMKSVSYKDKIERLIKTKEIF